MIQCNQVVWDGDLTQGAGKQQTQLKIFSLLALFLAILTKAVG